MMVNEAIEVQMNDDDDTTTKNLQECYNSNDVACQIVLFDGIVNSLVGHTNEAQGLHMTSLELDKTWCTSSPSGSICDSTRGNVVQDGKIFFRDFTLEASPLYS